MNLAVRDNMCSKLVANVLFSLQTICDNLDIVRRVGLIGCSWLLYKDIFVGQLNCDRTTTAPAPISIGTQRTSGCRRDDQKRYVATESSGGSMKVVSQIGLVPLQRMPPVTST